MKKIALCIPTYNEADNIAYITSAADNALKNIRINMIELLLIVIITALITQIKF